MVQKADDGSIEIVVPWRATDPELQFMSELEQRLTAQGIVPRTCRRLDSEGVSRPEKITIPI